MYKNILVPVLLGEGHDTQASYLVAKALAAPDAAFTVLHVLESIPPYVSGELPGDLLEAVRAETEAAVRQSARALPGAAAVLVPGHAGQTILRYADDHDVDCIILASHRPGMQDFFLGSTAARVVRHAMCSVHVIR